MKMFRGNLTLGHPWVYFERWGLGTISLAPKNPKMSRGEILVIAVQI